MEEPKMFDGSRPTKCTCGHWLVRHALAIRDHATVYECHDCGCSVTAREVDQMKGSTHGVR
jgi:predicted RNA-binding Zn-ribbon protein involved in translation (DUF1610 family)